MRVSAGSHSRFVLHSFRPPPLRKTRSVIGTVTDEHEIGPARRHRHGDQSRDRRADVGVTDERGRISAAGCRREYKVQAELQGFSSVVCPEGRTTGWPERDRAVRAEDRVGQRDADDYRRIAARRRRLVSGRGQRRSAADGEMPLQGRNWMELSKLVKGITANDVTNTPGVGTDDMFQLNLDGQQITQKIAGSGFGQPQVQPRVDRRVPDRHDDVRHHAGPIGRHPGAGDLEVGDEH